MYLKIVVALLEKSEKCPWKALRSFLKINEKVKIVFKKRYGCIGTWNNQDLEGIVMAWPLTILKWMISTVKWAVPL